MNLEELKKLCDEAAADATDDKRTIALSMVLLGYVPKRIAVAEAAKAYMTVDYDHEMHAVGTCERTATTTRPDGTLLGPCKGCALDAALDALFA